MFLDCNRENWSSGSVKGNICTQGKENNERREKREKIQSSSKYIVITSEAMSVSSQSSPE